MILMTICFGLKPTWAHCDHIIFYISREAWQVKRNLELSICQPWIKWVVCCNMNIFLIVIYIWRNAPFANLDNIKSCKEKKSMPANSLPINKIISFQSSTNYVNSNLSSLQTDLSWGWEVSRVQKTRLNTNHARIANIQKLSY